jgi:hypothetical protein
MPVVLSEFQETLEKFHRTYGEFLTTAKKIRPEDRERGGVCGVWSPKQVVAHLAGWLREEPDTIRKLMRDPGYRTHYDGDEFNARSVADRAAWDWDQTLADFADSYRNYEEVIAELMVVSPPDWRPITSMLKMMAEDFESHKGDLEQWLPQVH